MRAIHRAPPSSPDLLDRRIDVGLRHVERLGDAQLETEARIELGVGAALCAIHIHHESIVIVVAVISIVVDSELMAVRTLDGRKDRLGASRESTHAHEVLTLLAMLDVRPFTVPGHGTCKHRVGGTDTRRQHSSACRDDKAVVVVDDDGVVDVDMVVGSGR